MWSTESLWFETAIVSIIFAVGNMVMGHFEERTPKLRMVGKYILILTIVCGVSVLFGRWASMTLLALSAATFVCSWVLFAEEKRHQWLDRRTKKQILRVQKME
jgi:hypothetical protein